MHPIAVRVHRIDPVEPERANASSRSTSLIRRTRCLPHNNSVRGGHLARECLDPLLGGGIEASCDLLPRLIALLVRRSDAHLRPGAEIECLLPTEVPVVHTPEFRTVGLDDEVQPIGVGHLIGLASGLRVGDLDVIQCHDGAADGFGWMSPDSIWRFSLKICCKTSWLLDFPGRRRKGLWCPGKDSNLHDLAVTGT